MAEKFESPTHRAASRATELERDAREVRAILVAIDKAESEGRLVEADCWRCDSTFVEMTVTRRATLLRCLNCRKMVPKVALRSPLPERDAA